MDDIRFTVADCLAEVRSGDERAARALVEHLYPTVIRIVRRNLPRKASDEELAQDIFLKMFSNLDQYRGDVPLEHWVSRIATNHCLNSIRAQKSRPEWRMGDLSEEQRDALEAIGNPAEVPHPAHAIGARELVEMLLECLDPKDRLVIRLLEMEDRSTREISDVTGWPVPLVRLRAFRARRKLNKRYEILKSQGKI
jgi:RNA polymerase sigma-70 factor (ECF subfamily)